jgi:hypothetical protein
MKTDAELIKEFLAKGGQITKCPKHNPEPKKPKWNYWPAWGENKPGHGRSS